MRFVIGFSLLVVTGIAASCTDQTNPSHVGPLPPDVPGDDAGTDGDSASPPVIPGDPTKGILLAGTILGESGPYEGQVLALTDGTIGCAAPGDACASDPLAAGVAVVTVDGIIAPGLVDTHNHILFDIFDNSDWLPSRVYTNHNDWTKDTNEPRYTVMVDVKQCLEDASQGKPTWCPTKYDGTGKLNCEMEKWGELKGIIAGTTSIVGLTGVAYPCYASLARTIDTQFNGLPADKVQTAAITPSMATADGVCSNYASGKTSAYLIHVGEGTDDAARAEFAKLGAATTTPDCLYAPGTAITHGTSFGAAEFTTMKGAGMKLTWSPASNVALYNATTDIPTALDNGLVVALAPDWSMGGSQNMLDELRFAKSWSDAHWNGRLTSQMIVDMATKNGATVLGLDGQIGVIKKGALADLMVVSGDRMAPYDAIVAATPKEVLLTVVAGRAIYGDASLSAVAAGGPTCETFDACGAQKFLCVVEPGSTDDKLNQKYSDIHDILEAAMEDIDTVRPAGIGGNFAPVAPIVACK